MKSNKILLIGSNGYIGSALHKHLSPFHQLSSVDLCWFDAARNNCLIKDYNDLDESFIQEHDTIILLAGHSSVKMCEGKMESAVNNNVVNFINLLSKIKDKKLIYAGSSSVYGSVGGKTVSEDYDGFRPYNQYDISKHVIDLYAQKSDAEFYGLRFGTVNGYSPIMRNDVMINSMVSSALTDGEIKLYIKDIMRPILGIQDLCRAVSLIVSHDEDCRGIYNLASFNKTAEQIAYEVSRTINVPVKEYDSNPIDIQNTKLQTKCYNFSISTQKFQDTFKFSFTENIESITKSIVDNFSDITPTSRHLAHEYCSQ